MFSCYKHGWHNFHECCPKCFPVTYTASNSASIPIVHEQTKEEPKKPTEFWLSLYSDYSGSAFTNEEQAKEDFRTSTKKKDFIIKASVIPEGHKVLSREDALNGLEVIWTYHDTIKEKTEAYLKALGF